MKNDFYILLDIDGCITDGKNKPIDVLACHQLQQIIKKNQLNVLLCTGRSAIYAEAICQLLHITDWCICENGCYLYHPLTDEIIINPAIPSADLQYLRELKNLLEDKKSNEQYKIELGKEICISLNPTHENIESLYQRLSKALDLTKIDIIHSTTAVDITPKNINKGSGYDFWYRHVNQNNLRTIGIGDSRGDTPFLKKCDIVACPNNASPEIKHISSMVATQNSTMGVIEIIQTIIETRT